MGRPYAIPFKDMLVAASTDTDLIEINTVANKSLVFHSIHLAQTHTLATAPEENIRIELIRGYATSGSGAGSGTITPTPMGHGGAASGFTVESKNTTLASTGSPVTLHSDGMNNRLPYAHYWQPEDRPDMGGQARVVLRMYGLSVEQRMSGTVIVEEIGG